MQGGINDEGGGLTGYVGRFCMVVLMRLKMKENRRKEVRKSVIFED